MDLQHMREEMAKLAGRLTHRHGFICFPTADKVPCVKGWQQLTESYFGDNWSRAKGVGIQTGESSGITIVDIDEPDVPFYEKFIKHFNIPVTATVVTPGGGYHLYYAYEKELPHGNFSPIEWDIRNDGGYIMAPGSYYTNPKKPEHNWEKYKWKVNEKGEKLDFMFLTQLDEHFLKLKHYGIDKETMKFGERRVTFQSKESKKREVNDANKLLFLELMDAYAEKQGTRYREWLHGVWAITQISTEYFWDAEKLAVAWSKKQKGYNGPNEVVAKVRQYNSKKATYNLAWVLNRVSEKARKDFSKFKRNYCYYDYTQIFKQPVIDMEVVKEYVLDSFVRIDRNTNVMWYVKDVLGNWQIGVPFKDNPIAYKYQVPNPKYKPNDDKDPAPEFIIKESNMAITLKEKTLTWVPNYHDIQFNQFYGSDPTRKGVFNSFTSYKHKVLSPEEYDPDHEDFQFVMNHWFQYLCNANQEFFDYLMNWISWLLKYGYRKIGTAIVMHGTQGIGKGIMWEDLLWKGVIGESLVLCEHDMGNFTGRFNGVRIGKVLHIFDECTALTASTKVNWDKMKAIITDISFMAEFKNKEKFLARDTAGVVMLSNHSRCVDIPNDDRRYAIICTSSEVPSAEYFIRLARLANSRFIQRTFFTYLINRDVENWNRRNIPVTKSREESKNARADMKIYNFLTELVTGVYECEPPCWFNPKKNEEELIVSQRWYSQKRIYAEYRKYMESNGCPKKFIPQMSTVKTDLVAMGLECRDHRTDRSFKFLENSKVEGGCWFTGKQRTCWRIDRNIVREMNRKKRKNPNWDFTN